MALLGDVHLRGTRAAQPLATTKPDGTLYFVTDEGVTERSNGSAWQSFSGSASTGGSGSIIMLPGGDDGGDDAFPMAALAGAAGAAGLTTGDFELLSRNTIAFVASYVSGGTAGTIGIGTDDAPSISGTQARSVEAVNAYNSFTTAAAAGAGAGWRSGFALVQQRFLPQYDILITAPDILTNVRLWVGLTSLQFPDADTHTGHTAAFRFSSVAGDTGWRPVTRDGTTQNTGSNIGTVVAATRYRLRIRFAGSSVLFSVDGGTEQELSANIPGSTTDLGVDQRLIAQAASARVFKFSRSRLVFGV